MGFVNLEHLVQVATEDGLTTCLVEDFSEESVKKTLKIPEGNKAVIMTPVAYYGASNNDDAKIAYKNVWNDKLEV